MSDKSATVETYDLERGRGTLRMDDDGRRFTFTWSQIGLPADELILNQRNYGRHGAGHVVKEGDRVLVSNVQDGRVTVVALSRD